MERNRFLQLCQKEAVVPKSVIVYYDGAKYYPENLTIWFNENGETQNTARRVAVVGCSMVCARVSDVEEVQQ